MQFLKANNYFLKISFILFWILSFSLTSLCQRSDTVNLYFAVNKYQLNTYHRVELNRLLDLYSEVNYVSISGHADTTGSILYNLELSRRRAVSVKNYLFEIGLDTLIRDFNYYGEGRAVMPVQATGRSFSRGNTVQSDRRVETVTGGKPMEIIPHEPVALKENPSPVMFNDNIPPVITPVKTPAVMINAKLDNDVELIFPEGAFPDFIEGKIEQGEESLIKLIENFDQMRQFNMVTVTEDGTLLSPQEIVSFDSITFNHLKKDTAVTLKIPLNNAFECPSGKIKLYAAVNQDGLWKWQEQQDDFKIEKNNGRSYVSINVNLFHGSMNFAYPVKEPCFNPSKAILKLKNVSISQIYALLTNINCMYIPEKKDNDSYEIVQNLTGTSNLLLDIVARDNNNKIYNLKNFPITMCKYIEKENTYLLTKKDLQKYLKNY